MKKALVTAKAVETIPNEAAGMVIGKIAGIHQDGQILVDFPGNLSGPVTARITALVQRELPAKGDPSGREVLLAFVNNDLQRPVIVDAMYSVLDDIMASSEAEIVPALKRQEEALVDGKRVVLCADEEVVLKCGKASITLTRAGKVLIQGDYVLSSSTGANKIKGGSIQLN